MPFQQYYYSCESSICRDGRKTTTTTTITRGKPVVTPPTSPASSPPPPRSTLSNLFSSGPFSPVWQAWYDSPPPIDTSPAPSSAPHPPSPPADTDLLSMFDFLIAASPFASSTGISTDAKLAATGGKVKDATSRSSQPPPQSSPLPAPVALPLADAPAHTERPAKTTWLFAAAAAALVTSTVLANMRVRSARRDARAWRRDAQYWRQSAREAQTLVMRASNQGAQEVKAIGETTKAATTVHRIRPAEQKVLPTEVQRDAPAVEVPPSPVEKVSYPHGPRVDPHTDFLLRIAPDPSLRGLYAAVHPHEDWNWSPADWPAPHKFRSAWHRNRLPPWSAGYTTTLETANEAQGVAADNGQARVASLSTEKVNEEAQQVEKGVATASSKDDTLTAETAKTEQSAEILAAADTTDAERSAITWEVIDADVTLALEALCKDRYANVDILEKVDRVSDEPSESVETTTAADAAADVDREASANAHRDAEAALQAERERLEALERQMTAMHARLSDRDAMLAEREAKLAIETARLRAPPLPRMDDDRLKALEEEVKALRRGKQRKNDNDGDDHCTVKYFRGGWR